MTRRWGDGSVWMIFKSPLGYWWVKSPYWGTRHAAKFSSFQAACAAFAIGFKA